jgi:feruloyl esterase
MEGCGGFCGTLSYAERCDERMRRGYACIVTDMGHTSTVFDAKWAWNDREAEIDFGYRATHVTAVAGKAIATALYERAPQRSYLHGCSTGGRQGLVSAQRFPQDFDGIIAGAPVLRMPHSGLVLAWSLRALHERDWRARVTPGDVERLHAGALQHCDARDGLVDGIIGDPFSCDFDPASVAGLTASQVEAFRKVYDGPRDSQGRRLFPGGLPRGSELDWIGTLVARDGGAPLFAGFIGDLFRYLAFAEDPGPSFSLHDLDFDRDPPRLGAMAQILTGANPDLREYVARGGKLLLYHGAADPVVIPEPTVDYHEMVKRVLGGEAAARESLRLFVVPGMAHCTGGAGAHEVDWLTALEAWVERGEAPDWLPGRRPATDTLPELRRPIAAWPLQPRYIGKGDPNERASWRFEQRERQ